MTPLFLMRALPVVFASCLLTGFPILGNTLTFEGLEAAQGVDRFYSGVNFSHAVAAIAGIDLDDAELPPASGVTVALNDGGNMIIDWDSAVTSFEGLFTYT